MKDGPCGYCSGVRLVGWSGAGPILCPRCCDRDEDVFSVVTQAWREQRTRVVELEAELAVLRAELAAAREAVRHWHGSDHDNLCYALWPKSADPPRNGECNCGSFDNNRNRLAARRAVGLEAPNG